MDPKRRLTTATFASSAAMNEFDERSVACIRVWCTADPRCRRGLSPDLAARLRNVGARVRKRECPLTAARPTRPTHPPDVTEGYATHHLPVYGYSAPSSPSRTPAPLPPDHDIFRSAKDTLHQVRSAWPSGIRPDRSPRKRGRADSEHHIAVAADGQSMDLDSDDETVTFILGPSASLHRPTIPLRRPRRGFTETQSLPVGAFPFTGGSESSDHLDDEWGAGTFSHFAVGALE